MSLELAETELRLAQDATALSDFGSPDIVNQLAAWLEAGEHRAFTDEGRAARKLFTRRCLINRLRFADDVKRNPEILLEDVSDPIVVLGFPRSGTTVLQRMLSADLAVQRLAFWKVLNPARYPGEGAEASERIRFGEQVEHATRTLNPALFAAHPSVARDAEEDWFLHHFTFGHVANACCGPFSEEYIAYLRSCSRQETYTYVANLLRYLQWQDGGRRGRKWILKSPAHIGYIDEMLDAHPNATFVYPRRDFQTVTASFCYTLELSLQSSMQVDPCELGATSLDFWSTEMRRFSEARQRLGSRLKLLEIHYADMLADPIGHIEKIYFQAGMILSAEGEDAMRRWIAENPAGKHGKNTYALDRYGLSPAMVERAFGEFV